MIFGRRKNRKQAEEDWRQSRKNFIMETIKELTPGLEKQNRLLREALEFYADKNMYKAPHNSIFFDDFSIVPPVFIDRGQRAINALEKADEL